MSNLLWTPRRVPVPGLGDLFSEACGPVDGLPVLLVMGAMNPRHMWPDGFVDALVQGGCRVLRYDHRDTGRSFTMPAGLPHYALDQLVADALRVLDTWGVTRTSVVGWSMGGYIAQHLAFEHPERVQRLVLLASSPDHRPYMAATLGRPVPTNGLPGPVPHFLPALLATATGSHGRNPEDVAVEGWSVFHGGSYPFPAATVRAKVRAALADGHQPLAAMRHALAVDKASPRSGFLPALKLPTLVLHGASDPCLPLAHGQALADLIPGARLTVLDMGHLMPDELATPVGTQVASFIRGESVA